MEGVPGTLGSGTLGAGSIGSFEAVPTPAALVVSSVRTVALAVSNIASTSVTLESEPAG